MNFRIRDTFSPKKWNHYTLFFPLVNEASAEAILTPLVVKGI
jgi:hypothetical protein